ncbi:MAG: ComEC/Rec2 family competence protein [Candidatus Paceibacterota bacterium]|jgi:competence protein ComEC
MKEKDRIFLIFGLLIAANFAAWQAVFYYHFSFEKMEVVFFDVGQGDAIFIRTPQGHQILIDGGPDSAVLEKLAQNMPFWDRDIDAIISTHLDKDHLFGLLEVLKNYKVENIVWPGIAKETAGASEWQKLKKEEISGQGAKEEILGAGGTIVAGKVRLSVLYPAEGSASGAADNDDSLVARLDYGENSFLFCADISAKGEKELVGSSQDISAQVLKVSHHGSKSSTSEIFLEKVSPETAVIQVGRNSFGHPAEETLTRLEKFGINTLRTDIDGDVKFVADGRNLRIEK